MKKTVAGITYNKPSVYLLQENGLGVAEFASRTTYNSFDKSENMAIQQVNSIVNGGAEIGDDLIHYINELRSIKHSDLLDQLAHVYHHDSVLEHINLSYLVKGTSRGVLHEWVRHRIASYTVQSTRYTMSSIINAFIASNRNFNSFSSLIKSFNMFTVVDKAKDLEIKSIFNKLSYQLKVLGDDDFLELSLSNENKKFIYSIGEEMTSNDIFEVLESNKQKRNVGDNFKWIVTDNWKVDLVVTMNLRSLRNFLKLRDSGAAYFGIRHAAQAVIKATPQKYLDLISKKYHKEKE